MRPFILKDGSTSLRYFYDDAGFLREKMFTKRGIEIVFPCPYCKLYCLGSVSISDHVDSHHRKGGIYQHLEDSLSPRVFLVEDDPVAAKPSKAQSPLVADFV